MMTFFFKKGRKGVETTSLDELSRLAKVCGLKSKNFGSYMPKCSPEVQLLQGIFLPSLEFFLGASRPKNPP